MTFPLLPWLLASLLGVATMNGADDPDDPYQWLEEVLGDKPMAWVKERNAESTGELAGSERFRALEGRIREILDSDAAHPDDPEGRPLLLQLLARREEPAGPLAAHHAGGIPQGQARLGGRARPRRAGQAGARELGLARGPGAAARVPARLGVAVARRGRRGDRPRVRPGEEGVRQGRLFPARGQEPGLLAQRRTACSSAPTSARAR